MSRALLISALFLAGMAASPYSALAQSSGAGVQVEPKGDAQTDSSIPAKKGPLGGLLEPWDGKGDEIKPKKLHLGGVSQPSHGADDNKPKEEVSTADSGAKKKGLLSAFLGSRDDKPAALAKADAPAAKPKRSLLESWDDKSADKPTAIARADEPVVKKKGLLSALLGSTDDKPAAVADPDGILAKKGPLLEPWDDKAKDRREAAEPIADKTDAPVVKKKGPLGGLFQPWDSASDKP